MLAQGQRMTGNVDGALREAEAAVRVFEEHERPGPRRRRDPLRGRDGLAGAAHRRRPPLGRARHRGGARGRRHRAPAQAPRRSAPRSRTCAASTRRRRRTRPRSRRSTPRRQAGRGGDPARRHARRRHAEPRRRDRARASTRRPRSTKSWPTSSRRWSRPTRRATSRRQPLRALGARGRRARRCACTCARASSSPTERPLTRRAVKAALERSIRPVARRDAGGLHRHRGRRGVPRRQRRRTSPGIDAVADRRGRHPARSIPLPILPSLLTDGADRDRRRRRRSRRTAPIGTGPVPRRRRTRRTASSSSATRATARIAGRAPGPHRVPAPRCRRRRSPRRSARAQLDIARDLLPQDLEAVLREPRFRGGLVETPKKNTYFAVFTLGTPAGSNAAAATGARRASPAPRTSSGARSGASPCPRPA